MSGPPSDVFYVLEAYLPPSKVSSAIQTTDGYVRRLGSDCAVYTAGEVDRAGPAIKANLMRDMNANLRTRFRTATPAELARRDAYFNRGATTPTEEPT